MSNIESDMIGVSILCLAFNHEKFIADAIESFLMQKTSFPIEIIIHDDASTDETAKIIQAYERKFPDIIKPIYQKENQYSQGISINEKFFLPLIRGKYVALCDGDDYWTDPYKLQKQYDALENNSDCLACVHKVLDFDAREDKNQPKKYLPKKDIRSGIIGSDEFFDIIGNGDFFNEVCYFFNANAYIEYQTNYPEFAKAYMKNKTDDMPMLLYFGSRANVYYIADEMATYRRFTSGSWSDVQTKKDKEELLSFFDNSVTAIEEFNKYSTGKFSGKLTYIHQYFKFNLLSLQKKYKEMLSPEFDCVWERHSGNYRKRIKLLSKNNTFWGFVFKLYDKLRFH